MNAATSIYLDLVRFGAALVVFLGHSTYIKWTGGALWQIAPFAARAVDVFFVLSGFVIAYVTDNQERNAQTYAVRRLARIYSVALPSLLVTLAFDILGRAISPLPYSDQPDNISAWLFVNNSFFLNEIWNQHSLFGSNGPYWSVGYGVWYYAIFGLFIFLPLRWRWFGALGALSIAGPSIAILFPVWLLGVATYFIVRQRRVSSGAGASLCVGSVIAFIFYWKLAPHYGAKPYDPLTFDMRRVTSYLDNYATGLLFAAHLVGFDAIGAFALPVLKRFARQIRWIAGATFSLYLFHWPVIELMVALSPSSPSSWLTRSMVYVGTLIVVFVLAEFTERRKESWRGMFSLLWKRCFGNVSR